MSETSGTKKFLLNLAFVVLAVCVVTVSIVASVPHWRDAVRARFIKPYREVLAKAKGNLVGQLQPVSVIKLKTEEGIVVEVYQITDEQGSERLKTRLKVDERRDAFINLRGQATNLALLDLDGDGALEILVPVYDENLIPRLHVFKYVPTEDNFVKMGPDAPPLQQ